MLPNSPIEQISRTLSDLEKRIERLERLDQVFTINPTETVINEAGIDRNLRIEGLTEPNLFFVDAGNDRVGIGTNAPVDELHVVGTNIGGIRVTRTNAAPHIQVHGARAAGFAPGFVDLGRFGVTGLGDPTPNNSGIGQMRFVGATTTGVFYICADMAITGGVNSPTGFPGNYFFRVNAGGGAGLRSRLDLLISNIVFNNQADDCNVRIEGTGDPNLLFTDAGNDNIGIGTNAPNASAKLEVSSTTGSLLIPRMTTAQRNALAAVNGMGIYNTTTAQFEKYQAGAWVAW